MWCKVNSGEKGVKERKSLIDCFVDDFEVQNWSLSEKTKLFLSLARRKLLLLYTLDWFICHLIIGPSVVAFWRGTWDYSTIWFDHGLCAGDLTMSNLIALVVGLICTSCVDMFNNLARSVAGQVGSVRHCLVRHMFSVVWGVVDICLWKGVWDGVDHWAGHGMVQAAATFSTGIILLGCSRTVKSALSMPNGIVVDIPEEHIVAETYLDTGPGDAWSRRMTDCLISRVLEVATILLWHGIWTWTDILTEEVWGFSHLDSSLLSLALGWTGGLALFLAQFPLLLFSQTINDSVVRHVLFSIINFLFNLAGVFFTINSFRASWYLLGIYYLPSSPVGSLVTGQLVGVLILITLRCSSCLHAGVYSDSPDKGVTITLHHMALFFIQRVDQGHKKEERANYKNDNESKVLNKIERTNKNCFV